MPSKSILFNIDQKSDAITTKQTDALLSVFVKVFDEMCGYYGKQGYIAQFERDLDSRNLYEDFKAAFQRIANKPWDKGRTQAILEGRNIAKAYAEISGEPESSANGIIDKDDTARVNMNGKWSKKVQVSDLLSGNINSQNLKFKF